MSGNRFLTLMLLLLIFSLGVATGLLALPPDDSPQSVEQQTAEHHRAEHFRAEHFRAEHFRAEHFRVEHFGVELSDAEPMQVIVSTAEYLPGEVIPRHSHSGLEAVYVVQGAKVQNQDRVTVELATGTSLLNLRDVAHGGFEVKGEQPLKLFTVHTVDKDVPLYRLQ